MKRNNGIPGAYFSRKKHVNGLWERMIRMKKLRIPVSILLILAAAQETVFSESVDWQGPSGSKIKEIRYLKEPAAEPKIAAAAASVETLTNVIDSPPVDGFVPWIAITATNKALDPETTGIYDAIESSYIGTPPTGSNPRTDYFIGIFDTGASSHVIGYANAVRHRLYNSKYLTDNFVTVTGVTGAVDAYVSQPYGLFIDGLDALEPNNPGESEFILPSTSQMLGEYNVSTLIGRNPGSNPDLATAIGTPMSVFYDTQIEVDTPITVTRNGVVFTGPKITLHEKGSAAPSYPNSVPLELKPAGSTSVQYITYGIDFDDWLSDPFNFEPDYSPLTPSVVIGSSSQSLFFIHGVDLAEGGRRADNRDRFMLDTGAQISVIGSRIAARLKLNPANREFEVEIEGVTGDSIMAPGFYLDSLTIPAQGDWLEFTNVPVILLDIFSPEGGTLDGIIGMNLFTQYNLILRAGGFMLDDDPRLEFQRIQPQAQAGDIAPETRDNKVDLQDLSAFSSVWMTTVQSANWNPRADLAPAEIPDGIINFSDLMILADNWLAGVLF
jgi:hypothetical protein